MRDIDRIPTERSFGLSVGMAFAALGGLAWWREHSAIAWIALAVGLLLVVGGATLPSMLRTPNQVWWRLARTLGWLNTRVLLTLFFVLLVTPVGFVTRIFGRNPLRAPAGWRPYAGRRGNPKHYEHLF